MSERYSAFINAGAVVLLSPDMTEQERQDVLHSTLFAQLVADKKYPHPDNADKWYESYQGVLKDNWLQKVTAWQNFTIAENSSFTVADWVRSQWEQSVPQDLSVPAMRALDSVARLSGDSAAIELLRKNVLKVNEGDSLETISGCKVRLLVVLAQRGPTLNSVYLEFESAGDIAANPLRQLFSSDNVKSDVVLKRWQADLSNALYRPVRERIIKKLGDKAAQNILAVSACAREASLPGPGARV